MKVLRIILFAFAASPLLAFKGLFWWLLRRRVRGRRLIYLAASRHPDYYRLWIQTAEPGRIESYLRPLLPSAPNSLESWMALVICKSEDHPGRVETTIESAQHAGAGVVVVLDQRRLPVRLTKNVQIVRSPTEAIAALLSNESMHRWFIPLSAGDLVSPQLARVLFAAARANPPATIIFWDEDQIDEERARSRPWLKPSWDDLYFLVRQGLSGAAAYRVDRLASLRGSVLWEEGASECEAELALRLLIESRDTSVPVHVPLILSHRASPSIGFDWPDLVSRLWPDPLALSNGSGNGEPAHLHILEPQAWPAVSIIVPTRDRVDLLRTCLSGIEKLTYKGEVEIIIADNDSSEPETLEFFAEQAARGARIVSCPGRFNFASMNNRAARESTGSVLCLLNNDVEMIDGCWLEIMVAHAVRAGTGAVGALLLYPDQTVQHCGVAIGIGGAAGHVYRGIRLNEEGNRYTHLCTRRVSAVTGACLVVSRSAFDAVGGLDEEFFAVAFNDVDFCLKLGAAGFSNVFAAEAQLIHHESKSRGDDMSKVNKERYLAELARLKARWHTDCALDPFHSPLLARESEEFILAL